MISGRSKRKLNEEGADAVASALSFGESIILAFAVS